MSASVCGPRVAPDPVQAKRDDSPETLGQVREWERTKRRYLAEGLCHRCAANAAYGHQLGFSRVEPPRATCAMLVLSFPVDKPNGWRALPRDRT